MFYCVLILVIAGHCVSYYMSEEHYYIDEIFQISRYFGGFTFQHFSLPPRIH